MSCFLFAFFIANAQLTADPFSKNINELESTSSEKQNGFDFKFTNEELIELSKWKDTSFDVLVDDAFKCDRAALYMLGMSYLTGSSGFTIDVNKADMLFSLSASFGFAPSIKQLIHKNIEDENVFLILVYTNLITSFGHSEYVIPYHEQREKAVASFGNKLFGEIERIASEKKELIYKNIENLKKFDCKESLFTKIISEGSLVDGMDPFLGSDYWVKFTKFQRETEDEAYKFQDVLNGEYEEFSKLFEKSRSNLSIVLKDVKDEKSIYCPRIDFIKDVKKAISKSDDVITMFEKFENTPNLKLRKLAREFLFLSKNAKSLLELHYNLIMEPNEFLESKESVSKFAEYTAIINEKAENIKELMEKLK